MIKKDVIVKIKGGLHARPCGMIAMVASKYSSEIKLVKDGYEVNAKSIMGILSIGGEEGSVITIVADGKDEVKAVEEIAGLFESGFEE